MLYYKRKFHRDSRLYWTVLSPSQLAPFLGSAPRQSRYGPKAQGSEAVGNLPSRGERFTWRVRGLFWLFFWGLVYLHPCLSLRFQPQTSPDATWM